MFLKTLFDDFLNLLFPNCCLNCNEMIGDRKRYLCEECKKKIEYKDYHEYPNNNELFYDLYKQTHVDMAFAMCSFVNHGPVQALMHYLKYKGCTDIGVRLGDMYVQRWPDSLTKKFDVIVPVPLHNMRLKQRGYNQSDFIARGMSKYLDVPIDTTSVIRCKNTKSQTTKGKYDRILDMKDAFKVVRPSEMENKRILVVDDIITTGATITSCAKTIKNSCRCNVSVCAIAKTQHEA